jgi:hypothetical protein
METNKRQKTEHVQSLGLNEHVTLVQGTESVHLDLHRAIMSDKDDFTEEAVFDTQDLVNVIKKRVAHNGFICFVRLMYKPGKTPGPEAPDDLFYICPGIWIQKICVPPRGETNPKARPRFLHSALGDNRLSDAQSAIDAGACVNSVFCGSSALETACRHRRMAKFLLSQDGIDLKTAPSFDTQMSEVFFLSSLPSLGRCRSSRSCGG